MAQLPASLAVAGAAVVLFGLLPRASVAGAWTVVGVLVLIALFGQVLRLSPWILDVSPFTHVPRLPGAAVTMLTTGAPLLWLSLAVVALVAVGLTGLRRRDISP
jgi:ABC-2 type transport system permease protein